MYRTVKATKPLAGVRILCLALAAVALSAATAFAAGTPVGTPINNQAQVTYTNASDVPQTPVTSNVVTTTVAQKYSVDVTTANSPQTTLPGTTVYYPIRVTNTGNGPDSFTIGQTNVGNGAAWSRTVYADLNNNGVVDPGEPVVTSTGTMAADQTKNFVFALVVPPAAVAAAPADTTTTTVSNGRAGLDAASDAVDDQTNVTTGAVIAVSKAAVPAVGSSLDPKGNLAARTVNYTINFSNTGQAAATNLWIEDVIPTTPAGTTVPTKPTANPAGTIYGYTGAAWEAWNPATTTYTRVGYLLASLPVAASGSITFAAVIPEDVAPGSITNTASVTLGVTAPGTGGTAAAVSNPVTTPIKQTALVDISDQQGATPTQSWGGSVTINHTVTNQGNGSDTFNLSMLIGSLPATSTIRFLNNDGTTAVADTNGDGIPDTGVLAPAGTFSFKIVVTLPQTGSGAETDTFTVKATSVLTPAVLDTATDTLTINANPVMTLSKSVLPTSAKPGDTVTFTISYTVANTANAPAKNVVITDALPAGLTLVAVNNGGTSAAGVITWTFASLDPAASGSVTFTATVNAGQAATSTITNTAHIVYQNAAGVTMAQLPDASAALTVDAKAGLTLAPNNQANAAPGATQFYEHTITNSGNASDTVTLSAVSPSGWQYTFFAGTVGAPGAQITTVTVPAGGTAKFLVRVQVPAGAVAGTQDVGVITIASGLDAGATRASATDTTTVIAVASPNLVVSKTVTVVGGGAAIPGATLKYDVTVTNAGTAAAKNVVVTDAIPANTTYTTTPTAATGTVGSASVAASVVTWTVASGANTLEAGASATLTFYVTIN